MKSQDMVRLLGGLQTAHHELHRRLDDLRQAAQRDLWLVRRELLGRIARLEARPSMSKPWWVQMIPMALVGLMSLFGVLKPEVATLILRSLLH